MIAACTAVLFPSTSAWCFTTSTLKELFSSSQNSTLVGPHNVLERGNQFWTLFQACPYLIGRLRKGVCFSILGRARQQEQQKNLRDLLQLAQFCLSLKLSSAEVSAMSSLSKGEFFSRQSLPLVQLAFLWVALQSPACSPPWVQESQFQLELGTHAQMQGNQDLRALCIEAGIFSTFTNLRFQRPLGAGVSGNSKIDSQKPLLACVQESSQFQKLNFRNPCLNEPARSRFVLGVDQVALHVHLAAQQPVGVGDLHVGHGLRVCQKARYKI